MRVGPFAFRYQGNGATPCQYIDTTRKAIDCATTLSQDFRGKGSSLVNIFFVFYKTRHIMLSDSANCTVLRAVVLTQSVV